MKRTWKEIDAMTPEEIDELIEYNENFVGHTPNFENIQRHNKILDGLKELMDACDSVFRIKDMAPNKRGQTSTVMIDVASPFMMDKADLEIFNRVVELADSMVFAHLQEKIADRDVDVTRISFSVCNIWKD